MPRTRAIWGLLGDKTTACGLRPAAPITTSEVTGTVPRNAIVTLLPAEPVPMPAGPAVMDQYSKTFVPNVLYVRVGQPVEFRNVRLLNLSGCGDRRSPAYRPYFVQRDDARCTPADR